MFSMVSESKKAELLKHVEGWEAFHPSPEATRAAHAALARNKGVGLDDIPAELLQAGRYPLAVKYTELERKIVKHSTWPVQWREVAWLTSLRARAIHGRVTTRGGYS